jgi:outer membrane protein TolC
MKRYLALTTILVVSSVAHGAERLSVDDAVKLALENNPRNRADHVRADAAHDVARSVRGRLGFSLRLSEEYQHFDCPFAVSFTTFQGGCIANLPASPGMPPLVVRKQDTNTFAAVADQPILGLLHLGYDYAAQSQTADAADAAANVGEAALREAVRTGYLRLFEAFALEQIAAASVQELGEQVKVSRARLRAGVITNADLLRVVVAEANARQQQIVAHTGAEVARANLLNVIGLPADDRTIVFEEPTGLLLKAAAQLPDERSARYQAEKHRPEMHAAKLNASAADDSKTARYLAAILPEIDAEGGYLRIDGQLFAPANQWYVGVKASWPIWEWGASFYAARAQAKVAEAAALDAVNTSRNIATEVSNGLSQTRSAAVAVDVSQTAIASAEEAYRVTNALVQAGSATTTDLLDSQSALTTARLNLTRARYALAVQRVSLERVLGD